MMFGSRGQTEAPFQLLIAAVMLSMVIPISFYLFQQYQVWSSKERVQNNMNELARDLETVANLGEGEKYININFEVYSGPQFSLDHFVLSSPTEDDCMMGCHTPHCLLLSAYSRKSTTDSLISSVCVRIPFNVEFETSGCSNFNLENLHSDNGVNGVDFNATYLSLVAIKRGYKVYLCKAKSE